MGHCGLPQGPHYRQRTFSLIRLITAVAAIHQASSLGASCSLGRVFLWFFFCAFPVELPRESLGFSKTMPVNPTKVGREVEVRPKNIYPHPLSQKALGYVAGPIPATLKRSIANN